jgi:hypothetical protein
MKIQSEILSVERAPDGFLVQFAGGGARGAIMIESAREIPLVGQAVSFEYAIPNAGAQTTLVGLIPPASSASTSGSGLGSGGRAASSASSGLGSGGRAASSATSSAGSTGESDALLAFMTGGRNTPLMDRDVEAELDAFVGTREEVQRGLMLQRRR